MGPADEPFMIVSFREARQMHYSISSLVGAVSKEHHQLPQALQVELVPNNSRWRADILIEAVIVLD
jgi:hypothetical protein